MNLAGERHVLSVGVLSDPFCVTFYIFLYPFQELKKQCVQFIQDKGVEKVSLEDRGNAPQNPHLQFFRKVTAQFRG